MATKKKKTIGGASTEDLGDPIQKYLKTLKEYQNGLFAAVVLVVAVGVVVVWHHEAWKDRESRAWIDLEDAQKDQDQTRSLEKLPKLVERYSDTTAAPFLRIELAARLYKRGGKDDLLRARDEVKKVLAATDGNEVLTTLAKRKLDGIDAELAHADTWKALETAPVTSGGK